MICYGLHKPSRSPQEASNLGTGHTAPTKAHWDEVLPLVRSFLSECKKLGNDAQQC